MAAGFQSSSAVTMSLEDAPGGTARSIGSLVMELGGAKINVGLANSTAFGDAWEKHIPTGMRSVAPVKVSGHFNTTGTTGTHAVLRPTDSDVAPNADGRELILGFGDSKTFTVDVRIADYEVTSVNGKPIGFSGTLQPTGTGTWA